METTDRQVEDRCVASRKSSRRQSRHSSVKLLRQQQQQVKNQVNPSKSRLSTMCCSSTTTSSISQLLILIIVAAASIGLLSGLTVHANPHQATNDKTHQGATEQHQQQQVSQTQQQKADFEAELNSIVQQQQQEALEGNNKLLAEAIISRLMLDNLSAAGMSSGASGGTTASSADLESDLQAILGADELLNGGSALSGSESSGLTSGEQVFTYQQPLSRGPSGAEAQRLRKLLSFLQNYEAGAYLAGSGGGAQAFSPFPLLPSGHQATMKRAAAKMNAYLQTSPQRHLASQTYGRNSFDFGLGKRPDSSIANNILRFGDSSIGVNGGSIQPVGSFGKRPSAQRYDFGLGKRVANPAYPRYDFGLGKRAPNRIRYDFGLGK